MFVAPAASRAAISLTHWAQGIDFETMEEQANAARREQRSTGPVATLATTGNPVDQGTGDRRQETGDR